MENILNPILSIRDLCVSYTPGTLAIKHVTADVARHQITAIMGPSGCGKSTLLRAVNRMHELYRGIEVTGDILFNPQEDDNDNDNDNDNQNRKPNGTAQLSTLNSQLSTLPTLSTLELRRHIGMVFQRPNPFPTMSIADNVLAGYALNGIRLSKLSRAEVVERSLRSVGLWDEVKDSLNKRGTFLSGGQQQRLCIARALALQPQVLLMDEPTSALDPIATHRIEELMLTLKEEVTILIVTHNMSQAMRVADKSMFMYLGELVEYDDTSHLFTHPHDPRTQEYLTGKIG